MDYHVTWYNCCPHWDDVQWPWPGSISQRSRSHQTFNCQSTHALVCAITYVSLMDYHLTWYKSCSYYYYDDVHWPWPGSIPQRSRSHETFNGQGTHARVCAITYVCIDGLQSNLVQMLSSLRRCAVTVTRIHTSKVKVTQDI